MLILSEAQKDEVLPAPFVPRRAAAPSSPYDALASAQRGQGGGARGGLRVVAYIAPTVDAAAAVETPAAEPKRRREPRAKPEPRFAVVLTAQGAATAPPEPLDPRVETIVDAAVAADRLVAEAGADGIAIVELATGAVVLSTTRAAAVARLASEALAAERSAARAERQAARGPVCRSQNFDRASLWAKAKQTRVVFGHG